MDIQAVRLKQIQAQAAIQIMRAASVKTATTSRIRRDTVSISKDGIFHSVSITDKFATAYYGTAQISGNNPGAKTKGCTDKEFQPIDREKLSEVSLPDSYESLKDSKSYFYHGEFISDYDLDFLALLFGMAGGEKFYAQLCKAKATGDFTGFFAAYRLEAAQAMQEVRIEQLSKTGGIF